MGEFGNSSWNFIRVGRSCGVNVDNDGIYIFLMVKNISLCFSLHDKTSVSAFCHLQKTRKKSFIWKLRREYLLFNILIRELISYNLRLKLFRVYKGSHCSCVHMGEDEDWLPARVFNMCPCLVVGELSDPDHGIVPLLIIKICYKRFWFSVYFFFDLEIYWFWSCQIYIYICKLQFAI